MEIEKTRETSWKIQLKHNNENVEITSVEISGEVRIIKLALLKSDKSIKVEMNREEGTTLIVVTHSMELARRMGRLFSLRGGKLVIGGKKQ